MGRATCEPETPNQTRRDGRLICVSPTLPSPEFREHEFRGGLLIVLNCSIIGVRPASGSLTVFWWQAALRTLTKYVRASRAVLL
jgi:hypothetical protein